MAIDHISKFLFVVFVLCNSARSASIQQYVDAAISKGANQVVIPPGTYLATLGAFGVHLNITNVSNFAVYAYDVTMMCTVRARAIDMTDCNNVSIYGLVVDYDPLTFTQGTIVNVTNQYLDLKIHVGYPIVAWNRINVIDAKTGFFKDGMGFMWDITANISSPGVVRVYRASAAGFFTAQVGDYATLAGGPDGEYACHGIAINFSSNMSIIDTTIYCAPGFGLAEWGGEGGLTVNNFQIVPGPVPDGASEPRLQTSSWDGIEHTSVRRGPKVNNIKVVFAGDDTWSAVSDVWEIAEIDATNQQITFQGGAPYTLFPGDTLRLRNEDIYPLEEVVVVKVDMGSFPPLSHSVYCAKCAAKALRRDFITPNFTVSVDRTPPSNWNISDNLYSTDRQTSGFVLQNSYVYSKGRGALVKAPHGVIQNNYFEGGTAGVEVSPELSGASGSDACVGYNLLIRNNTIVHTGYHETFDYAPYGADGAIAFFSFTDNDTIRGPTAFRDMVVEDNTFDSVNGINIGIAAASGVFISGNKFLNTMPIQYSVQGQAYGFDNGYVVFLTHTANITLMNNTVYGEGPYKVGNLFVAESVSGITGEKGGIVQVNTTRV